MKPQPPVELLPDGHEWRVITVEDWWPTRGYALQCRAGIGADFEMCGKPSVAASSTTLEGHTTVRRQGVPYCADHIGSIRWVDGDRVMQWRAVPLPGVAPVTYRERRRFPQRARKAVAV